MWGYTKSFLSWWCIQKWFLANFLYVFEVKQPGKIVLDGLSYVGRGIEQAERVHCFLSLFHSTNIIQIVKSKFDFLICKAACTTLKSLIAEADIKATFRFMFLFRISIIGLSWANLRTWICLKKLVTSTNLKPQIQSLDLSIKKYFNIIFFG